MKSTLKERARGFKTHQEIRDKAKLQQCSPKEIFHNQNAMPYFKRLLLRFQDFMYPIHFRVFRFLYASFLLK